MNIVTIDAGTTNTRTLLWRDGTVLAQAQQETGVRNTAIDGHNGALKQALRETIAAVLATAGIAPAEVHLALASGMISSPMGLQEVPHLPAPAGLAQLAQGMQAVVMPDVLAQPLWLIPGVRNQHGAIGLHNVEAMDMMRGEETEVIGLLERLQLHGAATIIVPGSHTKLISVDEQRRILGCSTTIAGELLQAISQHTLIKQSVEGGFAQTLVPKMLLAGAAAAQKTGLARACFSVRTLGQFSAVDCNERANFLMGAVLSGDLLALRNSTAIQMRPDTPLVIAGKPMLRQALSLLIEEQGFFYGKRIVVDDRQQDYLAGHGALLIAAARGLITRQEAA